MFLFAFVAATAMADDFDPPEFAGADQWGVVLLDFAEESPSSPGGYDGFEAGIQPTAGVIYNPEIELGEDVVYAYVDGYDNWEWNAEEQAIEFLDDPEWPGGEARYYFPTPDGEGESLTFRVQVTYEGGDPLDITIWPEFWDYYDAGYAYIDGPDIDLEQGVDWDVEEVEPGVYQKWLQVTTGYAGEPFFAALLAGSTEWGGGGTPLVHQLVVDMVIHDGDEPPVGDGTRPGPTVIKVTNPSPADGEEHVHCDVNQVCFEPPAEFLNRADPNQDPNLQGPLDFYVYFSSNEAEVADACDTALVDTIENVDVNDQQCSFVGVTLPGETYYWRVDINDQNEPGEAVYYEGPVFSFVKWGFAYLISPEDGAEDIDPATAELLWENDGYGATQNVYVLDDQENEVDSTIGLGADANSFSPTGLAINQTYEWYVEEVNVQGTVESAHWFFSTAPCRTIDNFEDYTSTENLGTHWEDYDTLGGDNAVLNALVDTGTGAADEFRFEGNQSMRVTAGRSFIDPAGVADDYTSNSTDFSNLDLTSEGASSVAIAYRSTETEADAPDPSQNENMYVTFVSSAGNAMIDYPGDVTDPCWAVFYVALSEIADQGGDPCDLDEVRLGLYGDTGNSGQIVVYFDLLQRCGPICPLTEEGAVTAPAYTQLSNDLTGDCWVDADDLAVITENWLAEDVNITAVAPDDANLIVEYLFGGNLTDSSGNNNNGSVYGEASAVDYSGDWLVVNNNDDPCEVNGVSVPNVPTLLGGGDANTVTLVMDVNFAGPAMIAFSSGREPNNWYGTFPGRDYDISESYPLAIRNEFEDAEEPEVGADIFWVGFAGGVYDGGPVNIAMVREPYEGEPFGEITFYINGAPAGTMFDVPDVPDVCDDTTLIGASLNYVYMIEDGLNNFSGEIDNVKIYDTALEHANIVYLAGESVYQENLDDMDPSPNLAETGQFPENIINFLDQAVLAPDWMEKKFF